MHAGQHQMDDVLSHVVLTVGDVNLGAKHFVGAIGLWLGTGTHGRQVGTRLRLGQVHRACPFARDQFLKVSGFELVRACCQQGLNRTIGQHRAQGKTHVGRVEHFAAGSTNRFG